MQPASPFTPAHDSVSRPLRDQEPDPDTLWAETEPLINKALGRLTLDDSTLDKLYAWKIELVITHWSGKHHRVVAAST